MINHHKIVAALPNPLEADSVYYVRVGDGFDMYVTNGAGLVVSYKQNLSKDKVGLSEVDNTSDVNKPVSKAQKEALEAKLTVYPQTPGTYVGPLIAVSGIGQMAWGASAFGDGYNPVGGVGGASARLTAAQVGNLVEAHHLVGQFFTLWDKEENFIEIGLPQILANTQDFTGWFGRIKGDGSVRRYEFSSIWSGNSFYRTYVNGGWLHDWIRINDWQNVRREIGSFKPTLRGTDVAGVHSYLAQSGSYYIEADMCFVEFYLSVNTLDSAMSGYSVINLPINPTRRAAASFDSVYNTALWPGAILSANVEPGASMFLRGRTNEGDTLLTGTTWAKPGFTIFASAVYPIG